MENGNLYTLQRASEEALAELTKLWKEGEVRFTSEAVARKFDAVKRTFNNLVEIQALLSKFDLIANENSNTL
jgi:hypothetical protein